MSKIGIVFPHQLFEQNIIADTIYLVEEELFFNHQRKLPGNHNSLPATTARVKTTAKTTNEFRYKAHFPLLPVMV